MPKLDTDNSMDFFLPPLPAPADLCQDDFNAVVEDLLNEFLLEIRDGIR